MSSFTTTSSPARPTLFGLFERPATPERDIEAQTSSPVAPPSPARTHTPRARSEDAVDPIDTFFGVSHSRSRESLALSAGTRDSRHDELRHSTLVESETATLAPPSYEESLAPPAYTQVSDQPTLAMYLFKFGFLFPLFWVAGAFILLSPLNAPEGWEPSKPEHERQEIIESMRRTEVRWAKRCLYALLVFGVLIVAVGLSAFLILRS
ncbi:uncharacterized protein BXZ73DRAFT_89857 [Epithele typhae]|uniref:uncharacterized protein n=1 Tax=Epithele typhae TaxID=378194 RepID=UPI002008B2FF|nr:uncharacterized protein BXZ73DRAFT_89857 [Epithele typhae]KAH9933244.1 hypothetical protein BXZ73DRAFT_89857 [Epithele typhae]